MAEMWYVATPNITKSGFYKAQHDRKPPLYRAEATRNTYGVARSAPPTPPWPYARLSSATPPQLPPVR